MTQAQIRRVAWQFLLDSGLRVLPINTFLAARICGCMLKSYRELAQYEGSDVSLYVKKFGRDGFVFFDDVQKRPCICYNDELPVEQCRWTMMHELAHVLLGHVNEGFSARSRAGNRTQEDREADDFTARVLCPAVVLIDCCAEEPEEIMKLCGIGATAAQNRSADIKRLKDRGMTLTDPMERRVEKQFSDFVVNYLRQRISELPPDEKPS